MFGVGETFFGWLLMFDVMGIMFDEVCIWCDLVCLVCGEGVIQLVVVGE